MDVKTENTVTTTVEADATVVVNSEEAKVDIIKVPSCILLLFSEYLGYETPLIDWAEEWCNTKNFPQFKKNILDIDAMNILKKMKMDYSIEKIHYHWSMFYDIAIKNWIENLKNNDESCSIILP